MSGHRDAMNPDNFAMGQAWLGIIGTVDISPLLPMP